jgi:hypothetical protein
MCSQEVYPKSRGSATALSTRLSTISGNRSSFGAYPVDDLCITAPSLAACSPLEDAGRRRSRRARWTPAWVQAIMSEAGQNHYRPLCNEYQQRKPGTSGGLGGFHSPASVTPDVLSHTAGWPACVMPLPLSQNTLQLPKAKMPPPRFPAHLPGSRPPAREKETSPYRIGP